MLKNTYKYGYIKLAKGINLADIKTKYRFFGKIGISTADFGKKWYCLPNGKGIFKTFNGISYFTIREIRIINEFICAELCKQVGISAPKLEPATLNNISGLISYNVISNKHQKLLTAEELFNKLDYPISNELVDFKAVFNILRSKNYNIDVKKSTLDIYRIAVFDTITMQTDRHINNIFFLIDKKTKEVKVAPLIDNEFAFFGQGIKKVIKDKQTDIKEDIMPNYVKFAKIIQTSRNMKPFEYDAPEKNIVDCALSHRGFNVVLKDVLKKLDPQSAIENVRKLGYKIPDEYEEYITEIINTTRNITIKEYQKQLKERHLKDDEICK